MKTKLSCLKSVSRSIVFLIVLYLPAKLHPQSAQIRFEHLTVDQGLSQNTVLCILQDREGFMWFGTQDGLDMYDGYNFTTFHHDPFDSNSLSHNIVGSIYEDRAGILWIGTGQGLYRLDRDDRKNGKFIRYGFAGGVGPICENTPGTLWIGTLDGLIEFDREKGTVQKYKHNPNNTNSLRNNHVKTLHGSRNRRHGALWIGTNGGGLSRLTWDENGKAELKNFIDDPADPNSLRDNDIWSIYEDRSGILWVGTNAGGLNRFDRKKERFIHYRHDPAHPQSLSSNNVQTIFEDKAGILWIGTDGDGLNTFDKAKEKFIHYKHIPADPNSLSNNNVRSLYEDRTGTMWIGTNGGGIDNFDPTQIKFRHDKHDPANPGSILHNSVWAIYQDSAGDLWIGTDKGLSGLKQNEKGKANFVHYTHDPSNPNSLSHSKVRAIYEDRAGTLWIGTLGGGLSRFDRGNEKFSHYQHDPTNPKSLVSNNVYTIYEDRKGVLWIGANDGGLSRMRRNAGEKAEFKNYEVANLRNKWVMTIHESGAGPDRTLWLGTYIDGLVKLNPEKAEFKSYKHDPANPNSLSHDGVFSIHEDSSGVLWIGTYGGGLNRFDPKEEKFTRYTVREGLPNNVIYGILEDDSGNLWMGTNRGLSKFNPLTEVFRNYDPGDGVQSNEFNLGAYFKNDNGEMFFGGRNGFNSFYPKDDVNPYPPQIVLTSFKKFGKAVHFDQPVSEIKQIELSYKDDFFGFEFVALHYKNPAKNQYAYMMQGFDKDWVYIGTKHEATYTNLDAGEFTFRIKAANSDGVWNEKGAAVKIVIVPPFWKTWWFSLLLFGMLLGSAVAFHLYRVNRALTFERFKVQEREKIQKRIAADFHDDLGHRISKITWFARMLKQQSGALSLHLITYLDKIATNADDLFLEVGDFIWKLDPEKDALFDLAERWKHFSDELFDETEIAFQLSGLSEAFKNIKLPVGWKAHLFLIFKEAMNNILKHKSANDCKHVVLSLDVKNGNLTVELSNDGRGFDLSACANGNGIKNMHWRAEQIDGQLKIISQIDKGTTVRFTGKLP